MALIFEAKDECNRISYYIEHNPDRWDADCMNSVSERHRNRLKIGRNLLRPKTKPESRDNARKRREARELGEK